MIITIGITHQETEIAIVMVDITEAIAVDTTITTTITTTEGTSETIMGQTMVTETNRGNNKVKVITIIELKIFR